MSALPEVESEVPPFVSTWWHGIDQYVYLVLTVVMLALATLAYMRLRRRR